MTSQYPPVVVRTYVGSFAQTAAAFQADASYMAQGGYHPVAQSYEPGNWSGTTLIIALLLCLVAIGFAILTYMLIIRPDGALIVTYQLRPDLLHAA
jgi:hypothetical protein